MLATVTQKDTLMSPKLSTLEESEKLKHIVFQTWAKMNAILAYFVF